jgi:phospholipid/cholesterol/gamma-HCH transport system substrate-binding protein
MEPKVSYTLVGLFVILLGAALLSVVLWLGKDDNRVYDFYYAYMRESVSGLSVNAPVKYRGVDVGRVKEILLDPENPQRVQLTLEIARGTPIKQDTVATLSMQGLTGLAFVDLTGGSRDSPPLKAKEAEKYPVIISRPSLLMRMDQAVSLLLTNLNVIATDLHDLIDEESRTSFKELLTNLANLSEALATRGSQLDQLLASAQRTMESTEQVSTQLPMLITRMADSVKALQDMAQEITHTSRTANTVLASNEQPLEQFTHQTLSQIGLLVSELRQLAISLQRLAQQLEQEPDSLLFGRRPSLPGPGE